MREVEKKEREKGGKGKKRREGKKGGKNNLTCLLRRAQRAPSWPISTAPRIKNPGAKKERKKKKKKERNIGLLCHHVHRRAAAFISSWAASVYLAEG